MSTEMACECACAYMTTVRQLMPTYNYNPQSTVYTYPTLNESNELEFLTNLYRALRINRTHLNSPCFLFVSSASGK